LDSVGELRQFAGRRTWVVLDAPWYIDELIVWINFAIRNFEFDSLLFSLWPELIRPAAADERSYVLSWLSMFGHVEIEPNYLSYDIPSFERLAYFEREIGINFFWRKGDLVIFRPDRPLEELVMPIKASTKLWKRYLIGRRQIAIQDIANPLPPKLLPVPGVRNWRFDTVSRRDLRREQIQFWTSDNIVARVQGNRVFESALVDFFRAAKPFDLLTTEQQTALRLMSDLKCIDIDNRQAMITWQHLE
jgi:hypothetical protein